MRFRATSRVYRRRAEGVNRAGLLLVFALGAIGLAGCEHVHPWQRSKLAHPSMTTTAYEGPAADHMHAVQEGAAGGGDSPESGCGCN